MGSVAWAVLQGVVMGAAIGIAQLVVDPEISVRSWRWWVSGLVILVAVILVRVMDRASG